MKIKQLGKHERGEVIELVDAVFMQFEAPDYSDEGVKTFKNTALYDTEFMDSLVIYGAYDDDEMLLGVIAVRNEGSHIALFFVEGEHHRRGIGTLLFQKVLENSIESEITVNSSPYAIEAYHKLGFVVTAEEQIKGGIRYTPMVYKKASQRTNDTALGSAGKKKFTKSKV